MYQELAVKKWEKSLHQFDVFSINQEHQVYRRPSPKKYDIDEINSFISCRKREYGCLFLHMKWEDAIEEYRFFILLSKIEMKYGRDIDVLRLMEDWYLKQKTLSIEKIKNNLASFGIQKWWKKVKSKNQEG